MKIKSLVKIFITVFLLSGCATGPKFKEDEHTKIFRQDLDNNGAQEIIKVEDKFDKDSNSVITVMKRDGTEIGHFIIPGRFVNVEFIDLYDNESNQMAIHYSSKDNSANLEIYSLKNNKLSKLFNFSSSCGIDTNWEGICRIRVCKPGISGTGCSPENNNACDWDVWSWSGEKFIKEM